MPTAGHVEVSIRNSNSYNLNYILKNDFRNLNF